MTPDDDVTGGRLRRRAVQREITGELSLQFELERLMASPSGRVLADITGEVRDAVAAFSGPGQERLLAEHLTGARERWNAVLDALIADLTASPPPDDR